MSRLKAAILAGAAVLACPTAAPETAVNGDLLKAIRQSRPLIDLRLRAEGVDETQMTEEADALTLRGRLGFETGAFRNTALLAEADLVLPLDDRYNSTTNGHTQFPVVADPETYEINRLQLTSTLLTDTTLIVGRQRLIFDDHRFVANVGWRQNEQTYDAVHLINRSIPKWTLDVAYAKQVNRVFSKESPVGRYTGDNYFVNASRQTSVGKLAAFAYLTDFEQARADSTSTFGARLAGERPVQAFKVSYAFSYATQSERSGNPLSFSLDYYLAELTGTWRKFSLGAGIEVLAGNGVKGFATPLATLHKFQGWADKFLTTPPEGIEDRYVTLGYATKAPVFETVSLLAAYHTFDAQRTGIDYGEELDLQLHAKWRRFTGTVKYADYRAQRFSADASKVWLQFEYVW